MIDEKWIYLLMGIVIGGIISAVFHFNWALASGVIVVFIYGYAIFKKFRKTKSGGKNDKQ